MAWTYDDETGVYTVTFSELEDLLSSLEQNTIDTPYKINITELTSSDIYQDGPLARLLQSYNNGNSRTTEPFLYLDLRQTVLPNQTNMLNGLNTCKCLVYAPQLPSNVSNLMNCFYQCYNLKEPPVIPDTVRNMNSTFGWCISMTESPTIPSGIQELSSTFYHAGITSSPEIPTTVTDISRCFESCDLLTTVRNIPQQVTTIRYAFANCTSLKTIHNWRYSSISTNDLYSENCFTDCNAIEEIFIDEYNNSRRTNLVSFLNNRKNAGYFPGSKNPVDVVFYPCTDGFSIAFSNLNSYLTYVPQNTAENPYKLTITGLSVNNVRESTTSGTLGYVINQRGKYLDLSLTTLNANQTTMVDRFNECETLVVPPSIPVNVTTMERCFMGCTALKSSPNFSANVNITSMKDCFVGCSSLVDVVNFPPNVTNIFGTFYDCTSLEDIPEIPDTVTTMGGTFFRCTSLERAPVIPDSVTVLGSCFYGCTSLVHPPAIPTNVETMTDAFGNCTSLEVAPIIPDSVTTLQSCFSGCTSLVDVPIIPGSVNDLSHCFEGCSALKRVNFNGTFDLSNADFDVVFGDCDELEAVFVKSSANKLALIAELELQQNDGDFPSGLVATDIVKFDEKVMKIQTEGGTEIVDLYRFKEQLLMEKDGEIVYADESFKPYSVQVGNETFFAQTITESLLAICRNSGSGTVLKKIKKIETVEGVPTPMYQWITKTAGTKEQPFQRKYIELDVYTSDANNIELDPNDFPKGGVLLICSGAGQSGSDGGRGGYGQIKKVDIPVNFGSIELSVSFTKTATDGGKSAKVSKITCKEIGPAPYYICTDKSDYQTAIGSDGGQGGYNCTLTINKNGSSNTVISFGGGGGAGSVGYFSCTTCNERTNSFVADRASGGISGDGNLNTEMDGGNAGQSGDVFEPNESTTAKLVIGAYV